MSVNNVIAKALGKLPQAITDTDEPITLGEAREAVENLVAELRVVFHEANMTTKLAQEQMLADVETLTTKFIQQQAVKAKESK
jgi:hypothetical protein